MTARFGSGGSFRARLRVGSVHCAERLGLDERENGRPGSKFYLENHPII